MMNTNTMRKYEFTGEINSKGLRQIRAVRSLGSGFGSVRSGDVGGFIESESNLSHTGDSWVFSDAQVFENAFVFGNARVYGKSQVSGNAFVSDNALVFGNACVSG